MSFRFHKMREISCFLEWLLPPQEGLCARPIWSLLLLLKINFIALYGIDIKYFYLYVVVLFFKRPSSFEQLC
jgi:hypothetical protein